VGLREGGWGKGVGWGGGRGLGGPWEALGGALVRGLGVGGWGLVAGPLSLSFLWTRDKPAIGT